MERGMSSNIPREEITGGVELRTRVSHRRIISFPDAISMIQSAEEMGVIMYEVEGFIGEGYVPVWTGDPPGTPELFKGLPELKRIPHLGDGGRLSEEQRISLEDWL
ncbi:hypothetical protein QAD02_007728 [Eretmocerus hayati]|uniref:Uncharacterized protein n=1 Tax=Eretmocerus hayati TaxID=131215 RepID=A0ACC2N4R4_9HYME|nr:hypothetical protein QAD02_007728 [Eretmocerus hayati]